MIEMQKINELTAQFKSYLSTNYELVRLETIERVSVIGSTLLSKLLIGLTIMMSLLFFSFWAGFVLSDVLGQKYLGFAVVGAFYLLVGLLLAAFKKKLLEHPFREKIVSKMMNSVTKNESVNVES